MANLLASFASLEMEHVLVLGEGVGGVVGASGSLFKRENFLGVGWRVPIH